MLERVALIAVMLTCGCLPDLPGQGTQGRRPAPEVLAAIMEGGFAIQSAESGFGQPLLDLLTEDAIVLWPGAPIARGRSAFAGLLLALPAGIQRSTARIQANRRILSPDSTRILEWGVVALHPDTVMRSAPTMGRFMAVWRPVGNTWRIEALNILNLGPEFVVTGPIVATPVPPLDTPDPFVDSDRRFAAQARAEGARPAFAGWAAADAVTFRGDGLLNVGPLEIATALATADQAEWQWEPVATGSSRDATFGWTVGEAVITSHGSGGQVGARLLTKYMTFWRRETDGSIRFFADGGSSR